jgi:hypothetical protein
MLPCPVTTVVKFGVTLIFAFNLSDISGKNDFVIAPFFILVCQGNVLECTLHGFNTCHRCMKYCSYLKFHLLQH